MKISYRTTSYITISPFIEAIRLPSTLSTTNIDILLGYIIALLYTGFIAGETILQTTASLN